MIGQSGLHGWRHAKRLVNPAVIVVHEVQRDDRPLTTNPLSILDNSTFPRFNRAIMNSAILLSLRLTPALPGLDSARS